MGLGMIIGAIAGYALSRAVSKYEDGEPERTRVRAKDHAEIQKLADEINAENERQLGYRLPNWVAVERAHMKQGIGK